MPKTVIINGVSTSTNAGAKDGAGEIYAETVPTAAHPKASGSVLK